MKWGPLSQLMVVIASQIAATGLTSRHHVALPGDHTAVLDAEDIKVTLRSYA
jgi:hypothetical protein